MVKQRQFTFHSFISWFLPSKNSRSSHFTQSCRGTELLFQSFSLRWFQIQIFNQISQQYFPWAIHLNNYIKEIKSTFECCLSLNFSLTIWSTLLQEKCYFHRDIYQGRNPFSYPFLQFLCFFFIIDWATSLIFLN